MDRVIDKYAKEFNTMMIGYGAIERCGPADIDGWQDFQFGRSSKDIKEIVSLDGALCPPLIHLPGNELLPEDFHHNVDEPGLFYYFKEVKYLLSRFTIPNNYYVVAVAFNPLEFEPLNDSRFEFIGYDLMEQGGFAGISALTNCGGFDKAFSKEDINEYGIVSDLDRIRAIDRSLRENYPDEPHAFNDIYCIWRMLPNLMPADRQSNAA